MKIGIHYSDWSFSVQWVDYCKKNNIPYKLVNAYSTDIISQLSDCDCFMWHHHHANYKDALFAKQLLYSLQISGKKVFPDFNTGWHFDDKVGQKYLLESVNAPLVPSYVFYTKHEALDWINKTTYPKVFKLRGGAGAINVRLVKSKSMARKLVKKAFSSGFSQNNPVSFLKDRIRRWKEGTDSFMSVLRGIARLFVPTTFARMHAPEKGYVFFQDFIPDNDTDFRIKVVDGKCWGFQRKVRKGDFRASGSGMLIFDKNKIPIEMVKIAQKTAKDLKLQSCAFDFVVEKTSNTYLIVEMCYCFGFDEEEMKHGYWDENLEWHDEYFVPQYWMVENLIRE